jgi:hypothetical protein
MDIRICPNCGLVFDLDKRRWALNWDTIRCLVCDTDVKVENYERIKNEECKN